MNILLKKIFVRAIFVEIARKEGYKQAVNSEKW